MPYIVLSICAVIKYQEGVVSPSGKRLVVINGKFGDQDILDVLNKDFPQLNGVIPLGKPGAGHQVTSPGATTDNSVTRRLLGFGFKSSHQTAHDCQTSKIRFRLSSNLVEAEAQGSIMR